MSALEPFFATLLLSAFSVAAQQDSAASPALRPELARMAPLVGDWRIEGEMIFGPGQPWVPITGESRITVELGGATLREVYEIRGEGVRWGVICHRSWDQFQRTYRVSFFDDQWGLDDVYEGEWDDEQGLVTTNLRSGTFYSLGGTSFCTRNRMYAISDEGFQLDWFTSHDRGKHWFPTGRLRYRRADENMSGANTPSSGSTFRDGVQTFAAALLRHPDPYRYHDRAAWDTAIADLAARADSLDATELFIGLSQLAGMLRDGHTVVSIDDESELLGAAVPLAFARFSDGVCVRASSKAHADLLGARVTTVGGVPVDDAWRRIMLARPGENDASTTKAALVFLRQPDFLRALELAEGAESAVFGFELRDGTTREVRVDAEQLGNRTNVWRQALGWRVPDGWVSLAPDDVRWLARMDEPFWVEVLDDHKAAYLQFNQCRRAGMANPGEDPWLHFVERMFADLGERDIERLVIDLRHNNGGDTSMRHALVRGIMRDGRFDEPGRLFVLAGPLVESASAALAYELEHSTHAVFVGEAIGSRPTGFNDPVHWSRRTTYRIPGTGINLRVMTCVEQHSSYLDTRSTLLPDVPVALSSTDFASGKDPVLARALACDDNEAEALFRDTLGRPLAEPFDHPWRASQQRAWD